MAETMRDDEEGTVCRGCSVPLFPENARMTAHGKDGAKGTLRFVGTCRGCESAEARERYERRNPGAGIYTDERRKYPPRSSGRSTMEHEPTTPEVREWLEEATRHSRSTDG